MGGKFWITGVSSTLNIAASKSLTLAGTYDSPKPGSSIIAEPSRQNTSMNAKSCVINIFESMPHYRRVLPMLQASYWKRKDRAQDWLLPPMNWVVYCIWALATLRLSKQSIVPAL